MKKIIAATAASIALCGILTSFSPACPQAAAAASPKLLVDGEASVSPGTPFFAEGQWYVPVRMMTEYYPYKLNWDNLNKKLTLTSANDGFTSVLHAGSPVFTYFGSEQRLPAAAVLRKSRLYIPADALNMLTGATASVDSATGTIRVESGSVSTTVRTPQEPLAAAGPAKEAKLFAASKQGSIYKGFVLELEGKRYRYDWEVPRMVSREPSLYYADIDGDSRKEAVVVLITGYGTGLHTEEIHVVDPATGKERPVTPPEAAADRLIDSTIAADGEDLKITVKVKGKEPVEVRIPGMGGDYKFNDNGKLGFGGITYYSVEEGRLIAKSAGSFGFAQYAGDFRFVYGPGKKGLEPVSVTFEPYEDNLRK
ncbi:copper amine oxidase N-terminal domain-containing protein [Paenibacillus sp. CN-4]|uniref:copper amine oxidase N-terminal domain-containing protein n=1 Tax=Paenibacillus nanchangensis TaxID=3348343 RepID=UPI00397AFB91